MTGPRIGSFCTGYGGLDMAARAVLGGELAWVADPDPGPATLLAHHHPDIPNLGDITAGDFRADDPFAVPAERAPSPRARHVNAVARAVVEQARAPESARCHHGGIPGACPKCRREADPTRAAERILAEIKAEPFEDRRAERLARFAARYALPQRTTYGA